MYNYLFVFDPETGKRITSFAINVHGDTIKALKEKAEAEYPGYTILEGTDTELQQFLDGKVYRNGEITDYVPSDEETAAANKSAIEAEYANAKAELADAMQTALLRGDTETQESIIQEFYDMQAAYAEAVQE